MALNIELSQLIECYDVVDIARRAAEAILAVYESEAGTWDVQHKDDESPVTRADKDANIVICEGLGRIAPHIPVVSEENLQVPYDTRKGYQYSWCVDPLDGTRDFLKRNGNFTVNIALLRGTRPVLGVVAIPTTGAVYWAVQGQGAYMQHPGKPPRQLRCADVDLSRPGLVVVGSGKLSTPESRQYLAMLRSPRIIQLGSSLKLLMVAEGTAHIYPRMAACYEWDTAASHIVVEEAGGQVLQAGLCDDRGNPLEDWKGALAREQPLQYNKEDPLNPFFVVYGRRACGQVAAA